MIKYLFFDMDDVICDLRSKLVDRYNNDYNDNIKHDDIKTWSLDNVFKCGDKIYDYFYEPGFFRDLKPIEGAIETVNELIDIFGKDKIFILTSSPLGPALIDKGEWVQEYLPKLSNNIIFCRKKYMVQTKLCVLVDDGPHNVVGFYKHGGIPICYDAPYNKNITSKIPRAKNWKEIKDYILKINDFVVYDLTDKFVDWEDLK